MTTKVRITKKPIREYMGHAEPEPGLIASIDDYCRREQELYGHLLHDKTCVRMKFKANDLGYDGRDPIYLWIPQACFEEVQS